MIYIFSSDKFFMKFWRLLTPENTHENENITEHSDAESERKIEQAFEDSNFKEISELTKEKHLSNARVSNHTRSKKSTGKPLNPGQKPQRSQNRVSKTNKPNKRSLISAKSEIGHFRGLNYPQNNEVKKGRNGRRVSRCETYNIGNKFNNTWNNSNKDNQETPKEEYRPQHFSPGVKSKHAQKGYDEGDSYINEYKDSNYAKYNDSYRQGASRQNQWSGRGDKENGDSDSEEDSYAMKGSRVYGSYKKGNRGKSKVLEDTNFNFELGQDYLKTRNVAYQGKDLKFSLMNAKEKERSLRMVMENDSEDENYKGDIYIYMFVGYQSYNQFKYSDKTDLTLLKWLI